MRQQTLDDLSLNQNIIKAAGELLKSGSYAVSKPVRAGFTTSAIIAAQRAGIPVLYLAPTNAIIMDTVKKVAEQENSVRVPANSECPLLRKEIKEHPLLGFLPLPLPDCDKCTIPGCRIMEILAHDKPGLICLTYAKLAALMRSNSLDSKEILKRLSRQKVIIFDEAHTLSKPAQIAVQSFKTLNIPAGYPTLDSINNKWFEFHVDHVSDIESLLSEFDNFAGKWLARPVTNVEPITDIEKNEAWRELRDIACQETMNEADIITLRDMIALMNSSSLTLLFQHDSSTNEKYIMIASGRSDYVSTIKEFLHDYGARANHIYVSGTLYEPHPGYFEELSGKEIKPVVFPDFQNANGTFFLIPDRWKLNSRNFKEKLPVIIETVREIVKREQQPILLFAPNKAKARIIKQHLVDEGVENVRVDYYRSPRSMGVESKERVCIAVGMAETPTNSCDAMAQGKSIDEMWIDSGALRLQGVHADTWQAINRVKDPSGKIPSKVYMIGCRAEQIKQLARWGNNRHVFLADGDFKIGSKKEIYMVRLYEVKVDEGIDPSPIAGESREDSHTARRAVSDYIAGIEPYFQNSENVYISSTNTSRENVQFFGISNNPIEKEEVRRTAESLAVAFVNRDDHYGLQYRTDEGATWRKEKGTLDTEKLERHVLGYETFGSYELGLDDMVTWNCLDLDSHEGDKPITEEMIDRTRANLLKVIDVLKKYKIPFLVEASGSPGSWHVWILLCRTKTYNAYKFVRQIASEAGIKCEYWPKQKEFGKDGRYGNLVKVPICVNQKTGNRSVFLNPNTLEPLEGVIEHPGLVRLLEVPEPAKKGKDGLTMPKVSKHVKCDKVDFDPCMRGLIEDKVPLEGSEGHEMRLAIAIKAGMMGLDAEFAANMFKDQRDFDFEYSLKKIKETWGYGYKPYSCETLRDKCCEIVKPYCGNCGRCPA